MALNDNIDCPVDNITLNENQARGNAYQVLYITVAWIIFRNPWIIAFLILDFSLRALNLGKYSLLNRISQLVIKKMGIPYKPVDRAPKRFAAFVGLLFSIAILVFSLLDFENTSLVLAGILVVFATLEAVIGFCAGCHVYTFLNKFSKKPVTS